MTAQSAFGHAVIADEPTPSPITDRAGKPVLWRQTRTLTLADDSTAYGCAHCDYVSRNINSVRPHLGKHNRRRDRKNGHGNGAGRGSAAELSLNEIIQQFAALEQISADRDRWKVRAVKAEKSLRTLRDALGVRA